MTKIKLYDHNFIETIDANKIKFYIDAEIKRLGKLC